jgi:hypothetical protein
MNIIPMDISEITAPSPRGITPQQAILKTSILIGDAAKIK